MVRIRCYVLMVLTVVLMVLTKIEGRVCVCV